MSQEPAPTTKATEQPLLAPRPTSATKRYGMVLAGITLAGLTLAVTSRRVASTSTIRMAATGGRMRYGAEDMMATKAHGRCVHSALLTPLKLRGALRAASPDTNHCCAPHPRCLQLCGASPARTALGL